MVSDPQFPEGRYNEDDEGRIEVALAADPGRRKVVVQFPGPVVWLAMSPDDARALGHGLLEKADIVEGKNVPSN